MRLTALFFILVFNFVDAVAAEQCVDLFSHGPIKPFSGPLVQLQPWELPFTGRVVRAGEMPQDAVSFMQKRDGTYPLLLSEAGDLIFDHRLPDNQVAMTVPYLATHRGLYQKFKSVLGEEPKIVFAGQIRIAGGRPVSLVDQANTFHDTLEEMNPNLLIPLEAQLIQSNQHRLDVTAELLKQMGFVNSQTQILNFVKRASQDGSADGHVAAQKAAIFEMNCRAEAACWQRFLRMDGYLRQVISAGGKIYLNEKMRQWIQAKDDDAFEFFQIFTMFLGEGAIDVMAMNQWNNSVQGPMFEKFYQDLPMRFGPLH
jgi:hypothetical protein